jgi:hypothetical protein
MVKNAVAEPVNGDFRPSNRNMPKTRFIPMYKFSVEMHFIFVTINLLYPRKQSFWVYIYIGITLSVRLSIYYVSETPPKHNSYTVIAR